jgi:hypothetical protein
MNRDWHAMTYELLPLLEQEGFRGEVGKIKEVMSTSTSGTEIAMAIRWHLRQGNVERKVTNDITREKIGVLLRTLDELLS